MLSGEELSWLNDYHARVRHAVGAHVDAATKVWLDAATAPILPESSEAPAVRETAFPNLWMVPSGRDLAASAQLDRPGVIEELFGGEMLLLRKRRIENRERDQRIVRERRQAQVYQHDKSEEEIKDDPELAEPMPDRHVVGAQQCDQVVGGHQRHPRVLRLAGDGQGDLRGQREQLVQRVPATPLRLAAFVGLLFLCPLGLLLIR